MHEGPLTLDYRRREAVRELHVFGDLGRDGRMWSLPWEGQGFLFP